MGKELYYVWMLISQSEGHMTASAIVDELEEYDIHVGIKRVYSLITTLNDLIACFCGKKLIMRVAGNGYRVEDGVLEDGQLQFLLDMVLNNKNLDKEEQAGLYDRLISLSSLAQRDRLIIHEIEENGDKDMLLSLTTIIQAINHENNIRFRYIDYEIKKNQLVISESNRGNAVKDYVVSPYYLYYANGNHYLIGYYSKHPDHLTTFRLDRMRLVRSSRGHFDDYREQYDLEKEIHNINNYSVQKKETLHIQFHTSALREVADRFGTQIAVKKLNDCWIDAVIENVGISDGLKGWILMLNQQVKVITPLSLRDDLKNTLQEMLALYE